MGARSGNTRSVKRLRTQVGIVGAGPAGLMLSQLLARAGIESIVVERGGHDHVANRLRAGGLEHGSVALMESAGLAQRMRELCLTVRSTDFRFANAGHRIDFAAITGRHFTIYPQYEIVTDLIDARHAAGGIVFFHAPVTRVEGVEGDRPVIHFEHDGSPRTIECDFVAGCDGYHGPSKNAIPASVLTRYELDYPFGWLGILAEVPPPSVELAYSCHASGFALYSFRSPTVSRLYLQCAPDDTVENWSDDRIWSTLATRLDVPERPAVRSGPIVHRSVTAMRHFMVEPMQYGRLFLAGDAAHIVPPTGAKGLNAAFADVSVLAPALIEYYASGRRDALDRYSAVCVRRNWRVQRFSAEMCTLLHRFPDASAYAWRLQLAQLEYMACTPIGQRSYGENFTGLPFAE
jgi:p-hydroxybenzoate 3-monooxygenase